MHRPKRPAPPLAALLLATLLATPAGAAERHLNTITVEPLSLIFTRTVTIEYERAIVPGLSLFLAPAFTFDSVTADDTEASFWAVGVGLGARVFPFGDAVEGFFLSAAAQLAWARAERDGASGRGFGFALGGQVGYTWVLGGVVALSLGAGASYYDLTVTLAEDEVGIRGVLPTARAAIGVAF